MKKLFFACALILAVFGLTQCKPLQPDGEGITGTVTWLEGNQMPTISDSKAKKKEAEAIQRKVRVYPLLKFSDLKHENGLFAEPAQKPIAEVESDETGRYSVLLSPGRYSILTVEEGGLFASIFDGEGNVMPVTVKEKQWTLVNIEVNYQAAF